MPTDKPKSVSRCFAVVGRFDSQVSWLQRVDVAALGSAPPSPSAIVRRAVTLLTEHVDAMIAAGQLDGLFGPHPQDTEAERTALAEYARLVDAAAALLWSSMKTPPMLAHHGRANRLATVLLRK